MIEHVLIHGGKLINEPGWVFILSVWYDGGYLTVDDVPTYGKALIEADAISREWGGILVFDGMVKCKP